MPRLSLISTLLAALVLCLSVVRADLYNPGNPLNCTAFKDNCKALVLSRYTGNSSTSLSSSFQCNSTVTDAKPLCNVKVACYAVIVTTTGNQPITPPPLPGNGTNATSGAPIPANFNKVDLTNDLIAMYDSSKCGSNGAGALFQASTSFGALMALVAMVSVIIQTI